MMKNHQSSQLFVSIAVGMVIFWGAQFARGDEAMRLTFVSNRGEKFENAKVVRVEPDGVSLLSSTGISKIPFEELPEELRKQFGMNSSQVSQYRSQSAAAIQAREDHLRKLSSQAQSASQGQAGSGKTSSQSGSSRTPTSGISGNSLEAQNALRVAKNYVSVMPFSQRKLIEQLEYDGFSHSAAAYAATQCGANWNLQAKLAAKNYLTIMGFSKVGLVNQLIYDGFTRTQAEYGVHAAGY